MSPSFGTPSPRCCGSYDMPCEHWVSPSEQRQLDLAAQPERTALPDGRGDYLYHSRPGRTYLPRSTPQDDFTPYTEEGSE